MSNRFIEQIKNGNRLSCRFDPFGNINQFIIHVAETQTCIPQGNDNFSKIENFVLENNISPEYTIDWVEKIRDKDGNLLHYNTNLGPFTDSDENTISKEIKKKIIDEEIEVKVSDESFQISELEVSIFLPRSYMLTSTGSSPLNSYEFDSNKIGLPFSVKMELLQNIEDDYFEGNDFIKNSLRNTNGIVLKYLIDSSNVKKIYNWSKNNLEHELKILNESLENDYALYKRKKSHGPRTIWYFDWSNVQQYIWVPTLHITNKIIGLINQQVHRKTTGLISKDEIGDMACIRIFNRDRQKQIWTISTIMDSQINIFPEELNWDYRPIDIAFGRIRFLFDQGLYFESLVVTQAILESIINGMFDPVIVRDTFKREEIKWEQKYKFLSQFFCDDFNEESWLKSLFNGGLKDIYTYRNHFSHDFLIHQPDYSFNIGVYRSVKDLISPFIDTWESNQFLQEVSTMYLKRDEFLTYLPSQVDRERII